MTMDARKQRVLQAIVALYGLEGEPVGSSVPVSYTHLDVYKRQVLPPAQRPDRLRRRPKSKSAASSAHPFCSKFIVS